MAETKWRVGTCEVVAAEDEWDAFMKGEADREADTLYTVNCTECGRQGLGPLYITSRGDAEAAATKHTALHDED